MIRAEINDTGRRMEVHFSYSAEAVAAIKRVPGARFVPRDKGGPFWTVPLDLDTGRRLREEFGQALVLGDRLKAWGREEVQRRRNLDTLATANDAELQALPEHAPRLLRALNGEALPELGLPHDHALSRARARRGYQFADIAMMAQANVLNANQPGTGKTIEVIGALIESGLIETGPHIVVAPVKSLENVWATEIRRWCDIPVFTAEQPAARKAAVAQALDYASVRPTATGACFIVVNPDMVRAARSSANEHDAVYGWKRHERQPEPRPIIFRDHKGSEFVAPPTLEALLALPTIASLTIDEFHKMGLNNRSTLLHVGLSALRKRAQRAFALSGTPMGGKPRKLWPVFNWLEPELYTSFWRWADTWLEVEDNGYGKVVGGIQPGREREFYAAHARHLVRRLKRDALPGLPEQVEIIVECEMTPRQRKLYQAMERDAEVAIEGGRVSATNVLAEYTRLKQFANAACEVRGGDVQPTRDSGKLGQLLEKLDEEGIRKDDPEPGARALVTSESKRMVKMVVDYLREQGISCDELSGDTKDSAPIIERFEQGDEQPYVIVMTIQTGGVSLNLERAGSTHELDETWNPDDSEQFRDRADRGGRSTPLKCYVYRTKDTIQESIARVAEGKRVTNKNILDIARKINAERNR